MKTTHISRRTVLRGLGTALALPWLEAMAPLVSVAEAARGGANGPLRMAFLYVPNGAHMPDWTPKDTGTSYELPWILEPLAPFKNDFSVLSGLAQHNAYALGDGGGDHARSLSCFLTGVHPVKTDGANIRVGVSVDQVAADKVGKVTRFPSLELGLEAGRQSGNCDSGYSCAYSSNIAWRTPNTPVPKEINPRLVFERLFSNSLPDETGLSQGLRKEYRKSILDFVIDDANSLQKRLGSNDRRKVDEYLTSVRELETRVARTGEGSADLPDGVERPEGIPREYEEHAKLMCDMLALAFQGDLTRISTFVLANEGSNRSYGNLKISEGHHELSHHGGDPKKHEKIRSINRFHVTVLAYLIEKLKSMPEGDGNVLDNTMLLYGSGIGDGNRHNHNNLPLVLAGRGAGTLEPGQHIQYSEDTPLNNLYLSMLDRMGASIPSLGDSTSRLKGLGPE